MTLQTFAGLYNSRIVVPSVQTEFAAVNFQFLRQLLYPEISRVFVDESWYAEKYPDIKRAIAERVIENCRDHYLRFGYFENRMPYFIDVDEDFYLGNYPDVAQAVKQDGFQSGRDHFEILGYAEGRVPFAGFELKLIQSE